MLKIFTNVILALLSLGAPLQAAENAYDVLGKTLAPFLNLFVSDSANPNRAMSADLQIVDAEKLHPALTGQTLSLAVQSPDKLRLRAPVLGQEITICRNGQDIWAVPGSQVKTLLDEIELPKVAKKYKLRDFELPIPAKQLVFLPVLFQVADEGMQNVDEQPCRVLAVKLMPELAHSLNVEDWTAQLWVQADYKLARIKLVTPQGGATLAFSKLEFSPSLPAATWQPASEQTDVMHLTPVRYKQLLDAVTQSLGKTGFGTRANAAKKAAPTP